ncbi:hypothetical protein B0H14DRAFT_2562098 [Mycena olivaceomarginata]|nr:hypothetical protein B0H14DRAFT_2562098 [Mycena olivaceomarginata]
MKTIHLIREPGPRVSVQIVGIKGRALETQSSLVEAAVEGLEHAVKLLFEYTEKTYIYQARIESLNSNPKGEIWMYILRKKYGDWEELEANKLGTHLVREDRFEPSESLKGLEDTPQSRPTQQATIGVVKLNLNLNLKSKSKLESFEHQHAELEPSQRD